MQDSLVPYCERLATGAEPWNVASNGVFVLLGLYALARRRRGAGAAGHAGTVPSRPPLGNAWRLDALVALPFAIAGGSALYHAAPSVATQLADLIPIALFVAVALWLALERVLGLPGSRLVPILALWLLATFVGASRPDLLDGSLLYAPTILLLAALGPVAARRPGVPRRAPPLLGATALAFALALVARTLDLPLCPHTPIGLHPLWHLFSAIAGAFAIRLLLPDGSDRALAGTDGDTR